MSYQKTILSELTIALLCFSVLPAQAGYYQTVYVEDSIPQQTVVVREIVQSPSQTLIIRENNYIETRPSIAPFLVGAGLATVGIIAGSIAYNRGHHSHYRYKPVYRPSNHHRFHR